MNPDDSIDLSREAIKTCMMVGGPILIASLLIGLLVGVFQAMTQVQDQTVSFVPKILLLIVAIGLCLPWLTDQMLDFAKYSFEKPMTHWAGTTSQAEAFPATSTEPNYSPLPHTAALVRPDLFSGRSATTNLNRQPTPSHQPSTTQAPPAPIQLTPIQNISFPKSSQGSSTQGSSTQGSSTGDAQSELETGTPEPSFENTNENPGFNPENFPSPFILPHYRYSTSPQDDLDG